MQTCPRCSAQNRNNARFCAGCGNPLPGAPVGATGLLPPSTTLQNRYVVLRKIGQGGMGAVYQAQDSYLTGKTWAIKEMSVASIQDPAESRARPN